jgi:hypothetical protein
MMRTLLLSLVLVPMPAIGSFAQQVVATAPPAGSDWQHLQGLPAGASIQVTAKGSHANCVPLSVDSDTLNCARGKNLVFQRTDILIVKILAAAAPL